MKLPHKKAQAVALPNWHPDFRDVSALPDLKVVRTSFFVNVLCLTAALAAVLASAHREYNAMNMRTEIQQTETAIESNTARNKELLALNKEFMEAAQRFKEAGTFLDVPFVTSDLLVALSHSLPNYMDFTRVQYEENVLTLSGTIRGASETASTRVSAYLDVLHEETLIGKLFPDISIKSLDRDPRTQGLTFQIVLKTTEAAKAAKSAKK